MSWRNLISCFRRLRLKNSFHNILFVTFVTCLSAAYTSVYPFTYLPEMIIWFGYAEVEKGYYAGFVASSYFIGNAMFSYFWGWLSDRHGRKPVLIFQLMLTGVFCMMYGFCQAFSTAMIVRFFDGASNGVLTVGNAILYDNTDDSNQAFALSVAATAWGLGVCLGPFVSGYLASPTLKYPWAFDPNGFYGQYPYVIPSFVGLAFAIFNAAIVFIFLPSQTRSGDYEPFINETCDVNNSPQSIEERRTSHQGDIAITSGSLEHCTKYRPRNDDDLDATSNTMDGNDREKEKQEIEKERLFISRRKKKKVPTATMR